MEKTGVPYQEIVLYKTVEGMAVPYKWVPGGISIFQIDQATSDEIMRRRHERREKQRKVLPPLSRKELRALLPGAPERQIRIIQDALRHDRIPRNEWNRRISAALRLRARHLSYPCVSEWFLKRKDDMDFWLALQEDAILNNEIKQPDGSYR